MRSPSRFAIVVAAVMLAVAPPVLAGFAGTDLFLPMVGRQAGVYPSNWYTTVWIYNPGIAAATARVYFLERNTANPSPPWVDVLVGPGDTEKIVNAVEALFQRQAYGALRVTCATQKLVVTSRVYSKVAGHDDTDSMGQDFAGVPAAFAIGLGERTQILGTHQTVPSADSELRFNFGFVETAGKTVNVRVTACDELGALQDSKELQVREWSQRQVAFKDAFPTLSTENSRLDVEVISGGGKVIAYGSAITNGSQDPTTFEMQYAETLLSGGTGGGLTAVAHDATLAGDGTSGAPLGVADGGIAPAKLAAGGSTSGQVLTSSGSTVSWQNPGGFTLPYAGDVGSNDPAFAVVNSSGTVAVRGQATSTAQAINYGGYFEAYGTSGRGVAGATSGATGWGVYGLSVGTGKGVVGEASAAAGGVGVHGKSAGGDGVVGESVTSTKSGVYGFNTASGGYGIFGRNTATASVGYLGGTHGVWGVASAGLAHGGYFETSGPLAAGVYGKSTAAYGYGGVFEATGANAFGLLAVGPAGGAPGAAAIFRGNVQVRSRSTEAVLIELGEGLDYAEGFPTAPDRRIEPGAVLVIDGDGSGRLALAAEPYDRRVAGVVAGARGLGSAVRLAPGRFDHDVALAGRVYCNVDAGYGAVRAGDLLTTSATPGYAMAARDAGRTAGAILGKAMESLAEGERGQILVLVTLQ
jgi:hypothetical protein